MNNLAEYIINALAPLNIPVYISGDVTDDRVSQYIMVDVTMTGGHDGLPPQTLADIDISIGVHTSVADDPSGLSCRGYAREASRILSTIPINGLHGDWYLRYVSAPAVGSISISDLFHTMAITADGIVQHYSI